MPTIAPLHALSPFSFCKDFNILIGLIIEPRESLSTLGDNILLDDVGGGGWGDESGVRSVEAERTQICSVLLSW
jgi:hypothetical protein